MSDSEGTAGPSHHHNPYGGKSLASLAAITGSGDKPRYKSWRKKYRKMRIHFDGVLEENRRMFREEQKLEATAKRLRQELDGILDICLELNQNPSIPPDLRFDISLPRHSANNRVPVDITPEQANDMLDEYTAAVQQGRLPPLDLHIIRESIDQRLAAQDVPTLQHLETTIPHTIPSTDPTDLPPDLTGDLLPGFLTPDQERDHLAQLDARLGDPYSFTTTTNTTTHPSPTHSTHIPNPTELTSREFDRQAEMLNPHSQHNWLRTHAKPHQNAHATIPLDPHDDVAADSETPTSASKPPPKKRQKKDKSDLAKQVGDRAVEHARAREGMSPGGGVVDEEDGGVGGDAGGEVGFAPPPLLGKKKGKDPDGTYRAKGGKSGGSGGKGKRKRGSEVDSGGNGGKEGGSAKKARVSVAAAGEGGAAAGAGVGE
ncbi:hypothetical protein MBLNU230_g3858t1 [Neophaeotheca triangularis]